MDRRESIQPSWPTHTAPVTSPWAFFRGVAFSSSSMSSASCQLEPVNYKRGEPVACQQRSREACHLNRLFVTPCSSNHIHIVKMMHRVKAEQALPLVFQVIVSAYWFRYGCLEMRIKHKRRIMIFLRQVVGIIWALCIAGDGGGFSVVRIGECFTY